MPTFKIATWNVNSLKVRLPHVLDWLAEHKPDALALQELKMVDADFPMAAIEEAGYHAICSGQKTYNGVAVLSLKTATDPVIDLPGFEDIQRRVLAVTVNDVRVINLYVPNGESVGSEKYQYKLSWLQSLDAYLETELKQHSKLIVLGDFNIAPADQDVHDPRQWQDHVLCSLKEREAFQSLLKLGLFDTFRELNPSDPGFSWWDYRLNAFKRNMGLRIDHILSSKLLLSVCSKAYIDKQPRGLERPSDHTPVIAEFSL